MPFGQALNQIGPLMNTRVGIQPYYRTINGMGYLPMPSNGGTSPWMPGPVIGGALGTALEQGLEWLWDWATRPERERPEPQTPNRTQLPPLPQQGTQPRLGPPAPGQAGTRALAPFAQAYGLYHVTPCGNYASNSVIFETDPKGGLHAGMVKKISMAKLRRSIMAQVRSSGNRHHHPHRHYRRKR